MGKNKIFFTENNVDATTGELVSRKWISRGKVSGNKFVKLFISDVGYFFKCSPCEKDIIYACFGYLDYNTNKVVLNADRRKDMAEMIGCSINTVNVGISRLMKKGILIKVDRGMLLNPKLYFYGDDLSMNKAMELVIQYEVTDNVDLSSIGKDFLKGGDED